MNAFSIYCSPAGTTKHVAQVIGKTLAARGHQPALFDLGNTANSAATMAQICKSNQEILLFIGSPVYAFHAVPPVMEFIEQLPDTCKGYSVPFVTWGAVTSGIALYEMGKLLNEKGLPVIGAAKIVATHSLMWQFAHPLGKGRPDAADDKTVAELVEKIDIKLKSAPVRTVPLAELNYQPEEIYNAMSKLSIKAARQMLPQRQVIEEKCTNCLACSGICPVGAITFTPYPSFGESCIVCYNCMKLCPEKAIAADFAPMEDWLKLKAKEFNEDTQLKIFI
jgi:ferredoxin/flavodoxin